MKTKSCKYVEASEVFWNCPLAFDEFCQNPNCTWGDNNHSLVTPDVIASALAMELITAVFPLENADSDATAQKQIKTVLKRLKTLGQTYIDLEN